jgi:hypothetical protein
MKYEQKAYAAGLLSFRNEPLHNNRTDTDLKTMTILNSRVTIPIND